MTAYQETTVEKNKNYIMEITGMTHEGQGVGRVNGFAVFVDRAIEGEKVEVKIIKVAKNYAVGKLLAILEPSPYRVEPFCSVYKRCGGCNLQHMDYAAQLSFKTRLVRDALERIGGLKGIVVNETIGMSHPYNYRNKAQYPVTTVNGRIATGFYAARSHDVIPFDRCDIQDNTSERVLRIVTRFMEDKGIPAYDEKSGKGLVRHIMTRVGFNTGEIMVVLVINGKTLPFSKELVKRLVEEFGGENGVQGNCESSGGGHKNSELNSAKKFTNARIKSVCLNVNTEKTNVILGKENILIYGSEAIIDTIGEYKFRISPLSFFQVNPVQTEVLYSKAVECAGLTGNETVFDLYCGIGTISLFLSSRAKKVYGVEEVEAAVEDAKKNALLNNVQNAEFIAGKAEEVVPELYANGVRADVVVLDPPRKGCEKSLLRLLVEMQPERIVYVSCNPATLARDLKFLDGNGYKAVEVQPIDMFPWTGHVETITVLYRE